MSGQTFLVTFDEQIENDTWEALLLSYEKVIKEGNKFLPPEIDQLYAVFCNQWIDEMHKFLITNSDAFEVNPRDLERIDVEKVLAEHGFAVPSLKRFHAVLNRVQMSYISNNKQLMNGAVVEVW